MKFERLRIPDVVLLTPARFADGRGFFAETWNGRTLSEVGLHLPTFVQDNHSFNPVPYTVRGLHFQAPPHAQAKLVRCGRGRLIDVAVDIRQGSPTFGQWVAEELSFDNGKQIFIPEGFLHGYATLAPDTEMIYRCSDYYAPKSAGAVRYDDPDIAIAWPIPPGKAILSDADSTAPRLREMVSPFVMKGANT